MKKTVISLILVLALIFSLSACKSADSLEETESQTLSDSEEGLNNVLNALENLETNPDGSAVTSPIDGEIDLNLDSMNPSGENVTVPAALPEGKPVDVEKDKNGFPKKPLYAPYVNKYIKDGVYKLSCTYSTDEEGLNISMPFTLAVKGAKTFIAMDMTLIAGQNMPTHIITNGKKSYIILPSLQQYITSSPENNEDMLGDASNLITAENGKYVSTTEVKANGKTYICETYKEDSVTVKCYFLNGKTLDRQEIITANGNVILSDIKYSNDVEDELFELPEGYKNIDKLVGLMS